MVKCQLCEIKDKNIEKIEEVIVSQSKKDKGKIAKIKEKPRKARPK